MIRRVGIDALFLIGGALCLPSNAFASSAASDGSQVWLVLSAILIAAAVLGEVMARWGQPRVLGELLAGVVMGNVGVLGFDQLVGTESLAHVRFLAEIGVLLLLFEVGLESSLREMREVASLSGAVAVLGVVAPMALGVIAIALVMPETSIPHHLFVGATLTATSVGITARVLHDLGVADHKEAKVIVGAAVIDDILGLIVLSVVSAIALRGAMPEPVELATTIGLALGFLVAAVALGVWGLPSLFPAGAFVKSQGAVGTFAIGLALLLTGLGIWAGLAGIVGAFAAGLILEDVHVQPYGVGSPRELAKSIRPLVGIFGPIFFVYTGMQVDLSNITAHTLVVGGVLTVVAMAGKLVAGLGAGGGGIDRLTVGLGMIPRGEVGLIFAGVGTSVIVDGSPVIDQPTYAAVVLMVVLTTVGTPPLLAARLRHLRAHSGG